MCARGPVPLDHGDRDCVPLRARKLRIFGTESAVITAICHHFATVELKMNIEWYSAVELLECPTALILCKAIDDFFEDFDGLILHFFCDVSVLVKSCSDVGVPQPCLNILQVGAGLDEHGSMRVPKLVEAENG